MEDLTKLLKKRATLKGKMTHFQNYIDKISNCDMSVELETLRSRISFYKSSYMEFDVLQNKIEELSDPEEVMFEYRQ